MTIDPPTTALLVIDLQRGVVARNCVPHSAADVVANAKKLRGYDQLFVEDAMSGLSPGAHEFAITTIFPRMGRIVKTEELL